MSVVTPMFALISGCLHPRLRRDLSRQRERRCALLLSTRFFINQVCA